MMSDASSQTPADLAARLALANRLYREFYSQCFWHCRPNLQITEDLLPVIVKGLRKYGGHRGFVLASQLVAPGPSAS
jgi:hypothetical protein